MTASAEAAPAKATAPAALTTFTILETPDGGRTWAFQGTVDASNREQAERKFLGVVQTTRTIVALSQSAWQPTTKVPDVITRTKTVAFKMPDVAVTGAVEPPAPDAPQALSLAPEPEADVAP